MNIFALSTDPQIAAEYLNDSHVCKMCLESAQILSTVHWVVDCGVAETLYADGLVYAPTHEHHPCVQWAAESVDNWRWLREHALAIDIERLWRFPGRQPHKSAGVVRLMPEPDLSDNGLTRFAIGFGGPPVGPSGPVTAYRLYYMTEKRHLARWTRRGTPYWWV